MSLAVVALRAFPLAIVLLLIVAYCVMHEADDITASR